MFSLATLVQFLMDLLRDEDAQAQFLADPERVLAENGLSGVSAQDVCDAQPVLADKAGVHVRPQHSSDHHGAAHNGGGGHHGGGHSGGHSGGGHGAVHEIQRVINTHSVDHQVVVQHHTPHYNTYNEYVTNLEYTDNSVHAEEGATVVQDSFNQDNDGVDNKGGVIEDSNVANGDQSDVGNTDVDTTVEGSYNTDASETTSVTDSGNDFSDNSTDVADSFNDASTTSSTSIEESFNTDDSITVDDGALADAGAGAMA